MFDLALRTASSKRLRLRFRRLHRQKTTKTMAPTLPTTEIHMDLEWGPRSLFAPLLLPLISPLRSPPFPSAPKARVKEASRNKGSLTRGYWSMCVRTMEPQRCCLWCEHGERDSRWSISRHGFELKIEPNSEINRLLVFVIRQSHSLPRLNRVCDSQRQRWSLLSIFRETMLYIFTVFYD
jgi:hypothetical protein